MLITGDGASNREGLLGGLIRFDIKSVKAQITG